MKSFIVALMVCVGFMSFNGVSEAGPIRNVVKNVRENMAERQANRSFIPVKTAANAVAAPVRWVSLNKPVRGAVSNILNSTCSGGNCR